MSPQFYTVKLESVTDFVMAIQKYASSAEDTPLAEFVAKVVHGLTCGLQTSAFLEGNLLSESDARQEIREVLNMMDTGFIGVNTDIPDSVFKEYQRKHKTDK